MNADAETKDLAIVWLRQDLRLTDNPALFKAFSTFKEVVVVYIDHSTELGYEAPGGASRWWLRQSLNKLEDRFRKAGSQILFYQGSPQIILKELCARLRSKGQKVDAVFWNRRYEPLGMEIDRKIKEDLKPHVPLVESFKANLLVEPWEVKNKEGKPYQVYTPFWKEISRSGFDLNLLPAPTITPLSHANFLSAGSMSLDEILPLPKPAWYEDMDQVWTPGEDGGLQRVADFCADGYKVERNFPAKPATSLLSPHLHFGEVSPRQILSAKAPRCEWSDPDLEHFVKEICWREFAYHLLFHFPSTVTRPLRKEFEAFPWEANEDFFNRWKKGLTGFPIVDAGMRQLWREGWMHNRVRMIVASFLVKDLRLSWQQGERWFWDTLVDADLASNILGWQWAAGCGADAAPYFRVFNPQLQGEKFDPQGDYIRKYVPELKRVPAEWIHKPHLSSESDQKKWGVLLGRDYPLPMVDHKEQRDLALIAYESIKRKII